MNALVGADRSPAPPPVDAGRLGVAVRPPSMVGREFLAAVLRLALTLDVVIGGAAALGAAAPTLVADRRRRLGVTVGVFVLMVLLHSWSNRTAHEGELVMYLLTMVVGLAVLIVTARFALSRSRMAPEPPNT